MDDEGILCTAAKYSCLRRFRVKNPNLPRCYVPKAAVSNRSKTTPRRNEALWNAGLGPAYSTLILAARITLPHFSVSAAMNFPKSAGDSEVGYRPSRQAAP